MSATKKWRRKGSAVASRWTDDTRHFIRGAFLDHPGLKLVALALAVTLFVVINTSEERVIKVWHDVEYKQPEDRVLMSQPTDKVLLTIQGSWRRIRRFDERELAPIEVNLSDVQASEYAFAKNDIGLPEGLQLLAVDPPSIRLDFEPRVSNDKVAVVVEAVGQPKVGYKVTAITPVPATVTLEGAKSLIEKLESLPPIRINVNDRAESYELQSVPLQLPKVALGYSHGAVNVRVTIEPVLVERIIKSVPVVIKPAADAELVLPGPRLRTDPLMVAVTLRGPQSLLDVFSGATLEAYVEVQMSDLQQGPKSGQDLQVRVANVPKDVSFEVVPKTVRLLPGTARESDKAPVRPAEK